MKRDLRPVPVSDLRDDLERIKQMLLHNGRVMREIDTLVREMIKERAVTRRAIRSRRKGGRG